MTSRASVFALLFSGFIVAASAACTGGLGSSDCGSNACGACQSGFVNDDRCEGGEWKCECVPSPNASQQSNASTPEGDGSSDAGDGAAPPPERTCQQMLASPTTPGVCDANDWGDHCEQGCLACTCNGGTWGCTTSASCFDGG